MAATITKQQKITIMDLLPSIKNFAHSQIKGDVFRFIAASTAAREMLLWGYRMETTRGMIQPIENAPDKAEFWKMSGEYLSDKEQRIRFCKAIYYLSTIEQ